MVIRHVTRESVKAGVATPNVWCSRALKATMTLETSAVARREFRSVQVLGSESGVRVGGQSKGSDHRVRSPGQITGSDHRVRSPGQITGSDHRVRSPGQITGSDQFI